MLLQGCNTQRHGVFVGGQSFGCCQGFNGGSQSGKSFTRQLLHGHVRCQGPAATLVQLSFAEDWYWAVRQLPGLDWELRPAPKGNQSVLVLPTGPADDIESCNLFFIQAIM